MDVLLQKRLTQLSKARYTKKRTMMDVPRQKELILKTIMHSTIAKYTMTDGLPEGMTVKIMIK